MSATPPESPVTGSSGNQLFQRARGFARKSPIVAGLIALVALCVVCAMCGAIVQGITGGSGSAGGTGTNNVSASATNTPFGPTPTHGPTATPTPAYAHFGDGTFQVGKDIQPGTYRTRTGSPGCYYARLKGFGGTVDDIIANNNTDDPAIITIAASDQGFESHNCGTWTQNLSPITKSLTTFDDGMYFVGTDFTPGTYKNTGSSSCYYARLSGFGGGVEGIIANNNTDSVAIVTIKASDKGFESTRCGTWTKQ